MSNGEIIKFFSVIRLKVSNGAMKVGVDVSIKVVESGGDIVFTAYQKSPSEVRKII